MSAKVVVTAGVPFFFRVSCGVYRWVRGEVTFYDLFNEDLFCASMRRVVDSVNVVHVHVGAIRLRTVHDSLKRWVENLDSKHSVCRCRMYGCVLFIFAEFPLPKTLKCAGGPIVLKTKRFSQMHVYV